MDGRDNIVVKEDGRISGYAAFFDKIDCTRDVLQRGCFDQTLKEWSKKNRRVPILWQHDVNHPIGYWENFIVRKKGLYATGVLLVEDIPLAHQAKVLVERRCVMGLSIGFRTRDSRMDDAKDIRYIRDLDLMEISIVTYPAQDAAEIDNRGGLEWGIRRN
jgi:HK97 family phage prohead protease